MSKASHPNVHVVPVILIIAFQGCTQSPGPSPASQDRSAAVAGSGWQPDPALRSALRTQQSVLSGKATICPPADFELEEQDGFGDPVAVFSQGVNRIELMAVRGLPASATYDDFAKTTRDLHGSVSELDALEVDKEVELGEINGLPYARFRYRGQGENDEAIEGVYYLCRPKHSGPIWNVVAEGEPSQLPLLEASLLTFVAN